MSVRVILVFSSLNEDLVLLIEEPLTLYYLSNIGDYVNIEEPDFLL